MTIGVGINLDKVGSTQVFFDEFDRLKSIVLFSLFGDIDLLVAVLGRTDDLDNGD